MGIAGWLMIMTFTLAHWIFAHKYWTLSYKVHAIINLDTEQPNLKYVKIFNYTMFINIIFWTLLGTILFFYSDFNLSFVATRGFEIFFIFTLFT